MKKNIKYFILILSFFFCLGTLYMIVKSTYYKMNERISKYDSKTKNLMIVAHPDDESYWGGEHLKKDKYVVVCITCGTNMTRIKEFKKAMKLTNDGYITLGYVDKKNGHKDDWSKQKKNIAKDLKKIIKSKKWNKIITHNPEGEYGHIHHKITSKIVSNITKGKNLYYFGKYYKVDELPKDLNKIPNDDYKFKMNKLVTIYKSQKTAYSYFNHMFRYENWIKYEDWK